MKFNEKIVEIKSSIKELKTLKEEQNKLFRDKHFGELFKSFFEENPEINSVQWTQYTPYFNDGEECVFGVNDITYNRSHYKESSGWEPEDDEDDIDFYEGLPFVEPLVNEGIYETLKDVVENNDLSLADGKNLPYHCYEGVYGNRKLSIPSIKQFLRNIEININEIENQNKFFPEWKNAVKNFSELKTVINDIDNEIMQEVFGDHVSVIVTRDGIDINSYDHD